MVSHPYAVSRSQSGCTVIRKIWFESRLGIASKSRFICFIFLHRTSHENRSLFRPDMLTRTLASLLTVCGPPSPQLTSFRTYMGLVFFSFYVSFQANFVVRFRERDNSTHSSRYLRLKSWVEDSSARAGQGSVANVIVLVSSSCGVGPVQVEHPGLIPGRIISQNPLRNFLCRAGVSAV
jgi:hypothetical protein